MTHATSDWSSLTLLWDVVFGTNFNPEMIVSWSTMFTSDEALVGEQDNDDMMPGLIEDDYGAAA